MVIDFKLTAVHWHNVMAKSRSVRMAPSRERTQRDLDARHWRGSKRNTRLIICPTSPDLYQDCYEAEVEAYSTLMDHLSPAIANDNCFPVPGQKRFKAGAMKCLTIHILEVGATLEQRIIHHPIYCDYYLHIAHLLSAIFQLLPCIRSVLVSKACQLGGYGQLLEFRGGLGLAVAAISFSGLNSVAVNWDSSITFPMSFASFHALYLVGAIYYTQRCDLTETMSVLDFAELLTTNIGYFLAFVCSQVCITCIEYG